MSEVLNKWFKGGHEWFYLVFRVLVGVTFLLHGIAKWGAITSFSFNLMFFAGIIEIVGGAFLILGLWVRLAALVGGLEMLYAFVVAHAIGKGTINPVGAAGNGGEAALLFLLAFLVLLVYGAGRCALEKTWASKECF